MFGVNADVKNKEGLFMKSNKKDFKKIMKGRAKIKRLPRLKAYINDKKLDYKINFAMCFLLTKKYN